MMKKVFIIFFFITFLQSEDLVKVVASVNNEPITNIDLVTVSENFNLSEEEALKKLVQSKIVKSLAKKFYISANSLEINEELEKIAQKSNTTLSEFEASNQNIIEIIRENIKDEIIQKKLFNSIVQMNAKEPSEEEISKFYILNKDKVGNLDYELAKMQIKNYLYNQNAQEAIQTFMEKEESKALIKFY